MEKDYFGQKLKRILNEVAFNIFHKKENAHSSKVIMNQVAIENLRNSLISANVSSSVASKILQPIIKNHLDKKLELEQIKKVVCQEIKKMLDPFAKPIEIDYNLRPQVVAVCGLNGAGKTTTIGKMAHMLTKYSWKVTVAACDLTRKSAANQLKMLCNNDMIAVVSQEHENEKTTSVAKRAIKIAHENLSDLLLIDTNGCYPSDKNSIKEIGMIFDSISIFKKDAPHNVVLVIDATNGRNAQEEIEIFKGTAEINGIVVTKLDVIKHSAVLLSIVDKLRLPIHGIGIGSGIEDLQDFSAEEFAEGISGMNLQDIKSNG